MNHHKYAPVIITTLNRVEHLRRCIQSLQNCKYAEKTELYISVDYPPAEKYSEGYKLVCDYLHNGISGFLDVHIFYQEKNLGPNDNFFFLREIVFQKYDCFIASEDDNEFSYNFLAYMNETLEAFELHEDVLNICAIQEKGPWNSRDVSAIYQKICPAYGLGYWKKKELQLDEIDKSYFENMAKDSHKMKMLKEYSNTCFQQFVEGILTGRNDIFWINENKINWCDTARSIYAICEGKHFVAPTDSKVRNWGFDGSGKNMKKKFFSPEEKWVLDDKDNFCLKILRDEQTIYRDTKYIDRKYLKTPKIYVVKAEIKYWIWRMKH